MISTRRIRALVAILLATVVLSAAWAPTVGYVEQREVKIFLSSPKPVVPCNKRATVKAKVVRLKNGKPVANQAIRWSFVKRASAQDRLSKTTSTTNRTGAAFVKVSFGPKAGKRVIRARMPGLKPTITIRCRGGL